MFERAIIDRLVKPGSTALDVGANIGCYACLLAQKVGPTGQVLAFEPTPDTWALLSQNIAINDLMNTVQVFPIALAERKGSALLNVFAEAGSVYNSFGVKRAHGLSAERTITVAADTLDNVLAEYPPDEISFIKIDVEGAEKQVLEGARKVLDSMSRTVILMELNEEASLQCGGSIEDALDIMDDLGYHPFIMLPNGNPSSLKKNDVRALKEGNADCTNAFFAKWNLEST